MQKEAIFQLFTDKVVFQGIASRNFVEGEFCGLFTIKDVPFMIDHVFYSAKDTILWDVSKSKINHYAPLDEEEVEYICPFCDQPYRETKSNLEETICQHINAEPYISAIWGSCITSNSFEDTFNELVGQLNPKGMKQKTN